MPIKSYKGKLFHSLVLTSAIFCIGGFIYNSYETFEKFISGAHIVLTSSQSHTNLPLPVFVLCNETAYKELPYGENSIYQLSKYLQLTRDPREMMFDLRDVFYKGANVIYNVQDLHTVVHGRCLVIQLQNPVIFPTNLNYLPCQMPLNLRQ